MLQKKREQTLKDFIGNLRRVSTRPMAHTLNAIESLCLLTKDGSYRLFGYSLDSIRERDSELNGDRTHLIDSYIYDRDYEVELPLELANEAGFQRNLLLKDLVRRWQAQIPIRQLSRRDWHHPGSFYLRIGTDDSEGGSLPAGAIAVAQLLDDDERANPNPDAVYVLQFRNGYQCHQCIVVDGTLHLANGTVLHPGAARIIGRVRAFATELPVRRNPLVRQLRSYEGDAELVLPWEHLSIGKLFATEHKRFARSNVDRLERRKKLEAIFHSNISERTRRRYRSETDSEPHVDALIQMSLENCVRYSDVLRAGGYATHDANRFSLASLLRANRFSDLRSSVPEVVSPMTPGMWATLSTEFLEYSALFARRFPKPSRLQDRVLRVGDSGAFHSVDGIIKPGSWLLLEALAASPVSPRETLAENGQRPLHVLLNQADPAIGYLDHDEDGFFLVDGDAEKRCRLGPAELKSLRRVCGGIVPV
ncbi:MAG: hypothetical protein PW792_10620 [Acidobacteriaceae bacterium]|nr:hypothetical protein [Acidobacteriaceae bacterium]